MKEHLPPINKVAAVFVIISASLAVLAFFGIRQCTDIYNPSNPTLPNQSDSVEEPIIMDPATNRNNDSVEPSMPELYRVKERKDSRSTTPDTVSPETETQNEVEKEVGEVLKIHVYLDQNNLFPRGTKINLADKYSKLLDSLGVVSLNQFELKELSQLYDRNLPVTLLMPDRSEIKGLVSIYPNFPRVIKFEKQIQ